MKNKLKIGLIPAHRNLMDEDYAVSFRNQIVSNIIKELQNIELVVPDHNLTKNGLVRDEEDATKTKMLFYDSKVDAIIVSAITYGDEKSIFTIIEEFKVPVFIFAIEDPEIPDGVYFKSAAVCGLIPISYGLHRRNIKFTFGGIFKPNDKKLINEIKSFIKVTSAINRLVGAKIGMIGSRPNDFEVCAINEGLMIERYKQRIIHFNLLDINYEMEKIPDDNKKVEDIINQIFSKVRTSYSSNDLIKLAKFELLIRKYIAEYDIDCLTVQCWTAIQEYIGLTPCLTASRLTDMGYPIACEGDVHGALTMLMQRELTLNTKAPLFLDILMLHPKEENVFLAWHCGNAPLSTKNTDQIAKLMSHCPFGDFNKQKGAATIEFRIKPGIITVNRITEHKGDFKLLTIKGKMIERNDNIRGAWSWIEVENRDELFKLIINEGFTHHVSIIHEDLAKETLELSKYLNFKLIGLKFKKDLYE